MKFIKGQERLPASGIRKGQIQIKRVIRKRVHEILAQANKHPVKELMALMDELKPFEQAKIWLDLLQYVEPKLSSQQITIDDQRSESEERKPIDVTPMSTEDLITEAEKADEQD